MRWVRVSTTPHRSSEIAEPIKCILPKKEFRKSDLETLERSRESDIWLFGTQGPRGELYVVSHVGSFASEETIRLYTDACHEEQCAQTGKEVLNFGEFLTGSELRYINVDDRDTIIAELEALRVLKGVP